MDDRRQIDDALQLFTVGNCTHDVYDSETKSAGVLLREWHDGRF